MLAMASAVLLFKWARRGSERRGPVFSRDTAYQVRLAIPVVIILLIAAPAALMVIARSPMSTGQYRRPAQPIRFDHRIHAGALKVPCLYCHAGADRSAMAGLPATSVCLPCHNPQWAGSAVFAPVRQSLATGRAIPWRRVDVLPDFVYFDHSAHVTHRVACVTCHGRVDRMAQVRQEQPLTMGWCIQCHRQQPRAPGRIRLTDCTVCHR